MPYIEPINRVQVLESSPRNIGELNFVITTLLDEYLASDVSYSTINAVIGVLECAKMELYRRIAAPYEDIKMKENGDVYTCIPS